MSRRKIEPGTALNYIARAYFRADSGRVRMGLVAIFNQLKAGRIKPTIALARANRLLQTA